MIISQVVRETRALEDLTKTLDDFPTAFPREVKAAFERDVAPGLTADLQFEPGQAVHPFAFATPKSMRWYFAAVNGRIPGVVIPTDGTRYIRQHTLVKAWKIAVSVSDGAVALSISNPNKAIKFVTGARQVRGHAVTGWPLHAQTFQKWTEPTFRTVDTALGMIFGRQ
jgi:hypothetical protein